MASLVVQSDMWQILLLSICSAPLKFTVAEDQHGQEFIGLKKYSPLLMPPLRLPPSSNYLSRNFGERSFEVPYSEINRESAKALSNCPQLETLEKILVLLKHLLDHDDNSYVLQPNERMQILQHLKDYLERSDSSVSDLDNYLRSKQLVNYTNKSGLVEDSDSRQSINKSKHENRIEANFVLKYDISSLNNVGCNEALTTLIQIVKNAHLQLLNYCNQSGKCNLQSQSDQSNIEVGDKSNTLHSILTLDHLIPSQSKIMASNQYSFNVQGSNDYLNPLTQSHSALNSNQLLNTNNLNSGVIQTLNNRDKNVDSYNNIIFNKEASQSNIQHSDKSNVLNSILSFHQPIPTQFKITPANWNKLIIQNPLNNLAMSQNEREVTPGDSNNYLNLHLQPESYLNGNQFRATSILNTDIAESKNLNNLEKNFNIFDSNYVKKILETPTNTIKRFEGLNNTLSFLPTPPVEKYVPINNDPNLQLWYKGFQILNDKSASMAKGRIQYEGASIPRHDHNNFNYQSFQNPYEIKNFAPTLPNTEIYFDRFQNHIVRPLSYPSFQPDLHIKQMPYSSSININRHNSINHNSQQDKTIQSNFGLNIYAPTNLVDYPKRHINGNTLIDLHRWASVPNLGKLNSIVDNEDIVELTYKLKRPESISYSPYYYVKFRMPYKDFVSKINDLNRNPNIRSDPMKLHGELLSLSNVAEASSDLRNVERDEVAKLILNNGGTLINAKVLATNDSNAEHYLKTIQNLNANLNTNDILNLGESDKSYSRYTSLDSNITNLGSGQNPYNGELSNQNVNT